MSIDLEAQMLQPEGSVEQVRTRAGRAHKAAERASSREQLDEELRDGGAFASLYADATISEVLGVVKSGKEAVVYLARGGARAEADLLAVKVYKPSQQRSFRNAAVYQEGQFIGDDRAARAIKRGSGFGKEALQHVWVAREFATMRMLYEAGVAVPKPYCSTGSAIVMQYLGGEEGAAPRLRDVRLPAEQAASAWRWLRYDIELMLGSYIVHGDLSPYNILWWEERAWVIDLPQAVDPRKNRNAKALLERDITNCARYFARAGVQIWPTVELIDMWRRYQRAEL